MSIIAYHNSRILSCRRPQGALRCLEEAAVSILLRGPKAEKACVLLRLWHSGREEMISGSRYVSTEGVTFTFSFSAPEKPQLMWYYFIIDTDEGRLYYGARSGEGKLQRTPPEDYQITCYDGSFETPEWFRSSIVYQIFPDRFRKGSPDRDGNTSAERSKYHTDMGRAVSFHDNWDELPKYKAERDEEYYTPNDYFGGDLRGITEALPYLASLHVGTIYLNPVFEAVSNHRYNTSDYLSIDPILGTDYDFWCLTEEAKKYGIRIMLDGVFSHTGDDSLYFNKYGRYKALGAYQSKASPYYEWYDFRSFPDDYRCWWNFTTLPEVNELTPSYVEFIKTVLRKWTSLGAGAWRLDVADELPDDFIKIIRKELKAISPDILLLGEVWEDASNKTWEKGLREYVYGHELDSVMNYPFGDAVCDFLTYRCDAFMLQDMLASQQERYPEPFYRACMNLFDSHDAIRVLSVLSGAPQKGTLSREEQAKFVLSDEALAIGKKRLRLASSLAYSMPQPPCLYYGDEAGVTGLSDPFNRSTYPWGHEDKELLAHYRRLGEIRTENRVLTDGGACFLAVNADVIAVYRSSCGSSSLTVVNRSESDMSIVIRETDFREGKLAPDVRFSEAYTDALTGERYCSSGGTLRFILSSLSAIILIK